MKAFEKVIGYKSIKNELMQLCDMICNRKYYTEIGAKLPRGILLYGDPGLGKSLMTKCFIEASGLKAYTVRKNKSNGDFLEKITETFAEAKKNAPSIVFLDDMDKFANEDNQHCDADEYVAVQSGIDEIQDCEVLVLATANEIRKLPDSLLRSGRFDRKIKVNQPTNSDADAIIKYYLSDKKISDSVNPDDLVKMINYHSCAELETILNEAAVHAAYARREFVQTEDFVKVILRMQYDTPDNFEEIPAEDMRKAALHEAGHLVVSEALIPGSVGFAALRVAECGETGGFVHTCRTHPERPNQILVSLAGKAAVEMYYPEENADGCSSDIHRAVKVIRNGMLEGGFYGFNMVDVDTRYSPGLSENFNSRSETVTQAELERYMLQTRGILLQNKVLLEAVADALAKKGTLLYSDIVALKENFNSLKAAG